MFTPATAHGSVNGLLLGHVWDALMWLWKSRKTASFRQVARHGEVEGMSRWKATETRADPRFLLFCAPL